MTSKIFLKNFKIQSNIGIYEWERRIKQTLIIDLNFFIDLKKIAEADNIRATKNYVVIIEELKNFAQTRSFHLIETMAYEMANLLEKKFDIKKFQLTIGKPYILHDVESVGVTVERGFL